MLTQQNMEQIEFLSGNKDMLIKASSKAALPTWSEKTVDFQPAVPQSSVSGIYQLHPVCG